MRFVVISDTHKQHWKVDVPDGDVLLHAGDFTSRGHYDEIKDFSAFLESLPHQHKIVIAGNHDMTFESAPEVAQAHLQGCVYLQDESIVIEGIKIYGSPWQPEFFNWAFNLKRGQELREKWALIPDDVDILMTHGPPMGILDKTAHGKHVGCEELLEAIETRAPAYHIFGHIHEAYGQTKVNETHFINASTCNLRYKPNHAPVVFDFEKK
jgi:Icc-related predicted phosphoesterase